LDTCLPTGRPVCPCPTAGGPARRQAGTGRPVNAYKNAKMQYKKLFTNLNDHDNCLNNEAVSKNQ